MEAKPSDDAIERAIEAKAGGARSIAAAWRHAAQLLRSAGVSEQECAALVAAFSRPGALATLARCWAADGAGARGGLLASLAARADESTFSLAEWLAALEALADWLEAHRRAAPLSKMAGYVECSAELAGRHPGASLAEAVAEMARLYGFEG